ncbi:CHAT domain-containing protein [Mycena galopus ATCC 62051]|nr:CHAT domain-containing protein [Mycena galopus ATCC 62051]
MSSQLTNLGNSLLTRFEQLGDPSDINQSVSKLETAVRITPDGHPDKARQLSTLGTSLQSRFEQAGDLTDMNESISKLKAAVELTPDGHPAKPGRMTNLGNSLRQRFKQLGNLSDINQSISQLEAAVELTPDGHLDKPAWLNNLGMSLRGRFEQLGDLTDMNQSISQFEAAVKLTPDGHPAKPGRLSNLGNSLCDRFEQLGSLSDLNQSIFELEAAVALTPDGHPAKPGQMTNLGNSLRRRFEQLGNLSDINQSISKIEAAVGLTPDGHQGKPALLNSLGNSLLVRFEHMGNLIDIDQSVSKLEAVVAITPNGHPDKTKWLNNLGNSLFRRFEQLHDPEDYQQMLINYTCAASSQTGAAYIRFNASRMWVKYAQSVQHPSLLQACTTAIDLLPDLASLGLSISDRHHHILQAGHLVRDAASAAIAAHELGTAVEWLEQGRSVIWGQIVNLRTPLDDLRKIHPQLADELMLYSTQLDMAANQSQVTEEAHSRPSQSLQAAAQHSHDIAEKRQQLLKRIRKLAGFERFLLPKPILELSVAATMGPVVLLNISGYGCDALILMPDLGDKVMHVPLHDFGLDEAQVLAESLGSLVRGAARNGRLDGHLEGEIPLNERFPHILSVLWIRIVKPVLDGIAFTTPPHQNLGRIWWCPTGPLAFLPIHAAGLYGANEPWGSKLSDFFISSYTPSLTALIEGFRARNQSQRKLQILAVAQPSATGQSYIPGTLKEIDSIHRLATIPILHLNQDMATVESVQEGMQKSPWVHFACHGIQDLINPTKSALLLARNSQLTLSSIIELSLPNAELAFLSACQTATGSKSLEDESVHLTAGMLLAGYRGVIGTMWSIMDCDAPQVAADVYGHLFKTSPPDSTRAAEALHHAVKKLRDSDKAGGTKSFSSWVPFIHVGI